MLPSQAGGYRVPRAHTAFRCHSCSSLLFPCSAVQCAREVLEKAQQETRGVRRVEDAAFCRPMLLEGGSPIAMDVLMKAMDAADVSHHGSGTQFHEVWYASVGILTLGKPTVGLMKSLYCFAAGCYEIHSNQLLHLIV